MQNMDTLVNLEVLELYDNKIHEIKHFSHLVNLRLLFCFSLIPSVLDLSFNKIKEIPDLSPLQRLEELFPLSPTFPPLATSPATTSKTWPMSARFLLSAFSTSATTPSATSPASSRSLASKSSSSAATKSKQSPFFSFKSFHSGIAGTSPSHSRSPEQPDSLVARPRVARRSPGIVFFAVEWRWDISRIMEFQKSRGWRRCGAWTRSIWRIITSPTRRECKDSPRSSSSGWAAGRGVECSCRRTRLRRLKRWRHSAHCRVSTVCWKRCIWNTRRFMICRSIEKSAWRCCRRWSSWIRTRRVLGNN